jgi:anti-sigma B factor antagonist
VIDEWARLRDHGFPPRQEAVRGSHGADIPLIETSYLSRATVGPNEVDRDPGIELKVATFLSDGIETVELFGELDIATVETLRVALEMLDLDGALNLRIDMTRLGFLDSSGISVLVGACKRVRSSGGTFSVTCTNGPVRRAIEVSGLVEYLQVNDGGYSS